MIRTPQELFAQQLRRMLWVEQTQAEEILPELYDRIHAVDLRLTVERHILETQQHVRALEIILHQLGEAARPEESAALQGLTQERDLLLTVVDGERHLADLAHAEAITRSEHLEIAAYAALHAIANALGEEEIAAKLQELLEQEGFALELAERATAKLLAEKVEAERT